MFGASGAPSDATSSLEARPYCTRVRLRGRLLLEGATLGGWMQFEVGCDSKFSCTWVPLRGAVGCDSVCISDVPPDESGASSEQFGCSSRLVGCRRAAPCRIRLLPRAASRSGCTLGVRRLEVRLGVHTRTLQVQPGARQRAARGTARLGTSETLLSATPDASTDGCMRGWCSGGAAGWAQSPSYRLVHCTLRRSLRFTRLDAPTGASTDASSVRLRVPPRA